MEDVVELVAQPGQHGIVRDGAFDQLHAGIDRHVLPLRREQVVHHHDAPAVQRQGPAHEVAPHEAGPAHHEDREPAKPLPVRPGRGAVGHRYFFSSPSFRWVKVWWIPNRLYQSMAAATPVSSGVVERQAKSVLVFEGSSRMV